LKRLSILSFQFYRLLLVYNLAFTFFILVISFFFFGTINAGTLLFAMLVGYLTATSIHHFSAKETYFYFRNAGYRIGKIIIGGFAIDMVIYFVLIFLFNLITYAVAYLKS
jgi:hypothetical protein